EQYGVALDELRRLSSSRQQTVDAEIAVSGWKGVQGDGKLRAVLRLARGIAGIKRDATDFDADPDVLNTPAGIVDLRTRLVGRHDPAALLTRITAVPYVPGATDSTFKLALDAVDPECVDWLQLRLGQAITGYTPDDERAMFSVGGGGNGKTGLMDCLYRAL